VDPEAVPDYYDVVTSPLDLETIRMKVDEHAYHTKDEFLWDIEQIVFNAKEYNPMTGGDSRGRNIVHAANSLIDVIESFAYNFRKRLGYDIFKKANEVARRLGIPRPPTDEAARKIMPAENRKYYEDFLEIHEAVKEELGDSHPTVQKQREAEAEVEEQETLEAYGTAKGKRARAWASSESDPELGSSSKDVEHKRYAGPPQRRSRRLGGDEAEAEEEAEAEAEALIGVKEREKEEEEGKEEDEEIEEDEEQEQEQETDPVTGSEGEESDADADQGKHDGQDSSVDDSAPAHQDEAQAQTESGSEHGSNQKIIEANDEVACDGSGSSNSENVLLSVTSAALDPTEKADATKTEALVPVPFDDLAETAKLLAAMKAAREFEDSGELASLLDRFVGNCQGWSVEEMKSQMACLNRKAWDFKEHLTWHKLVQEISTMIHTI
jgi:hypothetical protein